MCFIRCDRIHLLAVVKWYWWFAFAGAMGYYQHRIEERCPWKLTWDTGCQQQGFAVRGVCCARCQLLWCLVPEIQSVILNLSSFCNAWHYVPISHCRIWGLWLSLVLVTVLGPSVALCQVLLVCDLRRKFSYFSSIVPFYFIWSYIKICWIFWTS